MYIQLKSFDERNMVYFFTKKGMIKKTSLKEYDGKLFFMSGI